jgi:F0F1-type ATP synthase assembly protein I
MAETTPTVYPSGDYSYVLEIVMRMQDTLGQLKEAVSSLKEQSKHHGDQLDQIGKDVHAAKVVMAVVGALVVGAAAFIGWIINTYISTASPH